MHLKRQIRVHDMHRMILIFPDVKSIIVIALSENSAGNRFFGNTPTVITIDQERSSAGELAMLVHLCLNFALSQGSSSTVQGGTHREDEQKPLIMERSMTIEECTQKYRERRERTARLCSPCIRTFGFRKSSERIAAGAERLGKSERSRASNTGRACIVLCASVDE